MVTLTTNEIVKIGSFLSDSFVKNKATELNELKIIVDEESFRKIDEDLFYRNRTDEKQEFRPSDMEIIVNFPFIRIFIIKKHE
jgi:hypothetical protein